MKSVEMRLRGWLTGLAAFGVCLPALSQPSAAGGAPAAPAANATAPAAASTSAQSVQPGAPVYNVEVIVFRALATLGPPEDWSLETGVQAAAVASDNDSPGTAPAAPPTAAAAAQTGRFVRALAPTEFQLNDIEAKLRASGGYAPVTHVGWAQTASLWGNHVGIPLQRLGIEAPELTGAVSLERGQFLHLGMQLSFTPQSSPSGLGAPPGTIFVMNDNHRVRFYERDYFDQPAFGVIALVTPVQGTRPAGR
jgi:hypothetical protein